MAGEDAPGELVPTQRITFSMRAMHGLAGRVPARRHRMSNRRPVLTLSFDDVPDSAATAGASILEAHGVRGTYFIATSLLGRWTPHWRLADRDQVARLAVSGHEIGLHSHAHAPVSDIGKHAFAEDMREARARLHAATKGAQVENYAYPFGLSDPWRKASLKRHVRSSRTTHPGLNAGAVDLHFLCSVLLGQTVADTASLDALLTAAQRRTGWLILTTHDVCDRPSPYGCTPGLLSYVVRRALEQGFAVVPVTQALDEIGVPGWATAHDR